MIKILALALALAAFSAPALAAPHTPEIPRLEAHGTTRQLIVDGKPFLILGGELANSTASDLTYVSKVWPGVTATGLNTVLAPVEWDQLEPEPGHFDFPASTASLPRRASTTSTWCCYGSGRGRTRCRPMSRPISNMIPRPIPGPTATRVRSRTSCRPSRRKH